MAARAALGAEPASLRATEGAVQDSPFRLIGRLELGHVWTLDRGRRRGCCARARTDADDGDRCDTAAAMARNPGAEREYRTVLRKRVPASSARVAPVPLWTIGALLPQYCPGERFRLSDRSALSVTS
jgi:hypothetical protein